jgi:hypothetical protein
VAGKFVVAKKGTVGSALPTRSTIVPITPKREIEIEEELAKIEAEIERDRKRPHKLMFKSKPRPP